LPAEDSMAVLSVTAQSLTTIGRSLGVSRERVNVLMESPDALRPLLHRKGCRACCNRAATGAGRMRTEQENDGARNAKNRLYKRGFPRGQYSTGKLRLTYKEEVSGSNPASPTSKSSRSPSLDYGRLRGVFPGQLPRPSMSADALQSLGGPLGAREAKISKS
jgi:hypothetical protein